MEGTLRQSPRPPTWVLNDGDRIDMKRSTLKATLLTLALFGLTAVVGDPSRAQEVVSPAALLGTWTSSVKHPSGRTLTVTVEFRQTSEFKTSSVVDGQPLLEASGRWQVTGNMLEWRYERSNHPSVGAGLVDTDVIESVSADEMTLLSKLSGKKNRFVRVRSPG